MVDSVYMVYIPVYSVYAIYERSKSVWWTLCIWCTYLYIVYMPCTRETSPCGRQCVYGVYTCIQCIYHIQERQVSVVDNVYMVYILVYIVYAIHRGTCQCRLVYGVYT